MTGYSRGGVEQQIEEGFPFLPSGCQIVLDRQAQALVLENIRSQIANRWQTDRHRACARMADPTSRCQAFLT